MIKSIKRWGNSLIISFNEEEKKIYNIESGDIAIMESFRVIKNSKGFNSKDEELADQNISDCIALRNRKEEDYDKKINKIADGLRK